MASNSQSSAQQQAGKRILHQVLDDFAKSTPSRLYASVPRLSDLREGFRDVTFENMTRCSNLVAHLIQEKFGLSESFETLCYIGIPDLRSAIAFLAALKCGYKVFFPSPRNPPSTNASLLEQTKCTKVLHVKEVAPLINMLSEVKKDIERLELPSFNEIIEGDTRPFTYSRQEFETAEGNPIVILHSSGSTGLPKPVTMTHGSFAILDNERNLPTVPGRRNRDFSVWDFVGGGRFYVVFPYFHLAGFLSTIVNPIFTESSSPVLGPPLIMPSGPLLKEIMQQQELRALYVPPIVAGQLLQEPNGIEFFKKLDFLCCTGGPFSPYAGEMLSEVTTLCPLYGSTEAFQVPQLAPLREDWAYMEWNPNFKYEMQASEDEKGTYEMVLFADEETRGMSALNHNFPGVSVWRTRDLFKPHPTKPNLWQYYGRTDDIIVFSNSEKFNPVPAELKIQGHSKVAGALIIGMGRFQAALLIEPKASLYSLKANEIIASLKTGLQQHAGSSDLSWLSLKLLYQNPTVERLSGVIYNFLDQRVIPGEVDSQARVAMIEALVEKYTKALPSLQDKEGKPPASLTVVLTGSTGSLGSSILRRLLQLPKIKKIICLNRTPNAQERQENGLRKAGISSVAELSRITYLTASLGKSNLGLSAQDQDALLTSADVIIHNAWTVDFNMSLASFEFPHLQGIRNIIDLTTKSPSPIPIIFISSVSFSCNPPLGPDGKRPKIKESIARNSALPLGYAESKHVAESILNNANSISKIPVSIIRVGQIAGFTSPSDPVWSEKEWVLPLIKASKVLAKIPEKVAPIDWVPIDRVAESIIEISTADRTFKSDFQVYNVVNPRPVSWKLLVKTLKDEFGVQAKEVPLSEWVSDLRAFDGDGERVGPALKLLDYFEMLGDGSEDIEYEMDNCVEVSRTMATLEPIGKDLLGMWLNQWGF